MRWSSSRPKHIRVAVVFPALALAGFAAAVLAVPGLAHGTKAAAGDRAGATTVTVVASDFKFKLSKTKVPVGRVTFKVVNRGKIAHDFKIGGKKTRLLKPGQSQSITVTFNRSGRFAYLCTVVGHAAAGMKGVLAVGKATAPPPPTTTTTAPPPTTTTTGPPPGAIPIQVIANEFSFRLSQTSIPAGSTVFFTVVNQGQIGHDFVIPSLGSTTPVIQPGQTGTLTVTFRTAGQVYYVCDLPQHAEAGMSGFLTVTG